MVGLPQIIDFRRKSIFAGVESVAKTAAKRTQERRKFADSVNSCISELSTAFPHQTESWRQGVYFYSCRPGFHFAQACIWSWCVYEFGNSQLGPPHCPRMVHGAIWDRDRTAGTRLATYPRQENDADLGADGIRKNARGISHLHRPISPK